MKRREVVSDGTDDDRCDDDSNGKKGFVERTTRIGEDIAQFRRGKWRSGDARELRCLRRPMHLGTGEIRARHTRELHTCELC